MTVNGAGSILTNSINLYVGGSGSGTLNITNGGVVTTAGPTYVASQSGSTTGTINFGDGGGTLTTNSLYAGSSQLTGIGTVNTKGLVIDGSLPFDSTHGANQTILGFGANSNITLNLDMSNANTAADLGAGYNSSGSLTIRNGITVHSTTGYLGYNAGSSGTATVAGTGSTWANSGTFYVGNTGSGALNITGGGAVGNADAYLGYNAGSSGTATVDGAGSTWTNSGNLYVGHGDGGGTLTITNGGAVGDTYGYISSGRSDGRRRRLDVDQQRGSLRRLRWQRNAEHCQRRRRQQCQRLHRLRLHGHGDGG